MFKIFRKSRLSSLWKGKTSKYLTYAIGEILLVMIGILLALQVNNWNESRKDRRQEQTILRQLHTEFSENLQQLEDKIAIKEKLISSTYRLFEFIDYPAERNKDSLEYHLVPTIAFTTFDPIVNDLSSSGNLRLIQSDSLKLLLSLWTSNVKDVQEDELSWKFYRNEIYVPFLVENYQMRNIRSVADKSGILKSHLIDIDNQSIVKTYQSIGSSKFKSDYKALLENPDFEDHLVRALSMNRFALSQSIILEARIKEILGLIKRELKEE